MPNIKSAIKRVKTSEKRRALNASQKSALRTAVKSADQAIAGTDVAVAKTALIAATKKLDKAVTKGLIHKNAAARKNLVLLKSLTLFRRKLKPSLNIQKSCLPVFRLTAFLCVYDVVAGLYAIRFGAPSDNK